VTAPHLHFSTWKRGRNQSYTSAGPFALTALSSWGEAPTEFISGGALPTSRPGVLHLPQVQPILVERLARPVTHPDWLFQPNYDGYRGVLYLAPRLALIASKRNNVLTRFRPLAERLRAELDVRSVILDGEVVALDSEGRQDFPALLRGEGSLHYAAFDLLYLNGRDLRGQPLWRRQRRLERLVPSVSAALSRVMVVPKDGEALFEAVQRVDLEGIVAKRKADPYGPEATWYKVRNPAYTQAVGRWELFRKR
jgi:bifunctional non-homologous end joining protein LigD